MAKKPYYLTTAIAYTSGKPHIGNVYEIVLADAIVRFRRNQGYDVRFQTGSDEHGQKVELKAGDMGVTPKEFVDTVSDELKRNWDLMNTSYDKFIRTTDEDHEKQVQKIFKKLYDQGDIYKGTYEGMYCTPCESFFTSSQLTDGKCPDCGRECQPAKEEAYFLKLSKYQDRLIEHINTHPEFIQPESRKNEMMNNFLLPGLQDLCVSRTSFKWGIPVDFDPDHVVYVWVDALSNYITGLGYDVDGNGEEMFDTFWPADLHLIGKDILRFHTIYWPIMLMALDLPLPKQIFGHPWLLQGDGKMSKSKGNVIYADEMVEEFGVDAVRYFLLHEMPFENDGVITWELVAERVNSELANTLGNLVKLIKYLNEDPENPLLDCMGMEGYVLTYWPNASDVKNAMTQFAKCGVPVGINELTVRLNQKESANKKEVTEKDITAHAQKYKDIFTAYCDFAAENPGMLTNVSIWGLLDRPDLEAEFEKPENERHYDYNIYGTHSGLFKADFEAKEAFFNVIDVLKEYY